MPIRVTEPREGLAWGVLWVVLILVGVIVAAGYFGWYVPTIRERAHGEHRSMETLPVNVLAQNLNMAC